MIRNLLIDQQACARLSMMHVRERTRDLVVKSVNIHIKSSRVGSCAPVESHHLEDGRIVFAEEHALNITRASEAKDGSSGYTRERSSECKQELARVRHRLRFERCNDRRGDQRDGHA